MNCVTIGSTIQFNEKQNFWDWMIGDAISINKNVSKEKLKSAFGRCIYKEKRHPYYLWFRTPEVLLNPDSFKNYPVFSKCGRYLYKNCDFYKHPDEQPNCNLPECCKDNILIISTEFSIVTGIIDYLLLYSVNVLTISEDGLPTKCSPVIGLTFLIPLHFFYNLISNGFKIVIYIPHDIIKTALVPIAGGYYTIKAIQGENNDKSESGKKFPVTNHQILTTSIKKEIK